MKKPTAAKPPTPASIALEMLTAHKTIDAAAPPLAERIAADATFRLALAVDYLKRVAPKKATAPLHARRRQGPHKRPREDSKMPTKAQKIGALQAERHYTHKIFERKLRGGKILGDVRVHELRAYAEHSASTATSFLTRGYDDAVETIAFTMLANHCVAADPFALVKDTIKSSIAVTIFERAQIKAAEVIRDGSAQVARNLLQTAKTQELTQ